MILNYKVFGEGEPVVILHGLFGMLDNWISIAKQLSDEYMVFLLDLRNHGRSFHSEEWNLEIMAEDVQHFLEEHWIYNPTIIGHSMGGKVAMYLALHTSDFIRNLVVVDISAKEYERGHNLIFEALNALPIHQIRERKEADDFMGNYIGEETVRRFLLKNLKRNKENGFEWKMNLTVISDHYEEILAEVESYEPFTNPTLFMRGMRSPYILEEDMIKHKELFTQAELVDIPKAGHWLHAEQPKIFIEELRNWMKGKT